MEFFEDTGQPSPGSPLSAVPDLARKYGIASSGLVTEVSDGLMWVGFSPTGRPGIFKLKFDDFSIEEISNAYICQLLEGTMTYSGTSVVASTWARSNVVSFRNKELALFPIIPQSAGLQTFVYDNDLKQWGPWTTSAYGSEKAFPGGVILRVVNGIYLSGTTDTGLVSQNQKFWKFDPGVFQDNSASIDVFWASDFHDFGTMRRKTQNSIEIMYDQIVAASFTFQISYGDDNLGIPTTARSVVAPAASGKGRAKSTHLGSFRKRKYFLRFTDNQPLRIGAIEVDIDAAEDDLD
jgi:hypothetical protein